MHLPGVWTRLTLAGNLDGLTRLSVFAVVSCSPAVSKISSFACRVVLAAEWGASADVEYTEAAGPIANLSLVTAR